MCKIVNFLVTSNSQSTSCSNQSYRWWARSCTCSNRFSHRQSCCCTRCRLRNSPSTWLFSLSLRLEDYLHCRKARRVWHLPCSIWDSNRSRKSFSHLRNKNNQLMLANSSTRTHRSCNDLVHCKVFAFSAGFGKPVACPHRR